jgi:hypothetical protein
MNLENKIEPLFDRATLIVGKEGSNKALKAYQLAKNYGRIHILHGDAPLVFNRFQFSEIPTNCKVIIVDNCPADFDYTAFYNFITEGIWIERQMIDPVFIRPKFIFTTSEIPKIAESGSFLYRFQLLEFAPEVAQS